MGVCVGDRVEVASDNRRIIGIAAFFVGYALGSLTGNPLLHALITVVVTAAGCFPAVLCDRRSRRQGGIRFTIQRKL